MTTEAGKRLMEEEWDNFDSEPWGSIADHVDAIEAEARAAALAEVYGYAEHYLAREKARISNEVKGRMVTRTRPAEHDWSRGFRDGWNDAIGTVLRIIEGETDD